MQVFLEGVKNTLINVANTFSWTDLLDIALVAYLVYQAVNLLRQTRAAQLMRGIVVLVVGFFLAQQLQLKTIQFLLRNVLSFGIIAIAIIFQPELRRALERVGSTKFSGLSFLSGKPASEQVARWTNALVAVCDSAEQMAKDRTGALIVIERHSMLGEIISTGTSVDAETSTELIETIFYKGSPLHDGAIVIRNARIKAAGCLLPVSQNLSVSKDMGTRHRAAMGMSENSDALIVVVSEETGIISLAQNGIIIRRLDRANLFRLLQGEILPRQNEDEKDNSLKGIVGRILKK